VAALFRRRLLVTGLSGLIGTALRAALGERHDLRALNRRAVPGVVAFQADVADLVAIQPAFDGVDTVVHLAANAESGVPFEDTLRANVIGTYNVFEAARRARVRRVVFASSGATVSGYERDEPYRSLVEGRYEGLREWPLLTHETPVRPAGIYGTSKVWGEALARQYADVHGLSMLCVRIGRVRAEDRPMSPREFSVFCSQRDVCRMLQLCIDAPEALRFDVFFAQSRNRWSYRDLEHPRAVLGFEPEDAAEDYREGSSPTSRR
jgi:nucleoside-diphosphate-sugar epimerase